MSDERLMNVESALAFQERTVAALSDVIREQQEQIDLLKVQLATLTEQISQDEDSPPVDTQHLVHEKPPHY